MWPTMTGGWLAGVANFTGFTLFVWRKLQDYVLSDHPDDGGSKHLWNIGILLLDYMVQTTQKTAIYIHAAMRTSNLTYQSMYYF
jgi:hypothetical protein